jgi:hypothetical protein
MQKMAYQSGMGRSFLIVILLVMCARPCMADGVSDDRVGALDRSLSLISQDSINQKGLIGGTILGSGTLTGLIGALFLTADPFSYPPLDDGIGYSGCIAGLVLGGAGLLILLPPTEAENSLAKFRGMPADTSKQMDLKLAFGESYLKKASADSEFFRILGGIVFLAAGGGVGAFYGTVLFTDPELAVNNSIGYTALGLGLLYLSGGITMFCIETTSEREYRTYRNRFPG